MGSGSAGSWIRSNILGLIAIFIALSGSAVAIETTDDPPGTEGKAAKE